LNQPDLLASRFGIVTAFASFKGDLDRSADRRPSSLATAPALQ
jgi:hypothetical protein